MSSIITGLFESQEQANKIAADLENAGFENRDYILYITNHPVNHVVKTSVWQYFFRDNTKLEDDSLVVSVKVKTPDVIGMVRKVFDDNDCIHQNYFENIKFSKAKSLQYLKRIASIRAKAEIFHLPEIHHHATSDGITSEVVFGKT